MALNEPVVSAASPMPKGYGFLEKGSPYMTSLCRRKTHAAKRTLYVVTARKKPIGLRAPKSILDEVFAEERATRDRRQQTVQKRDVAVTDDFSRVIHELYPKIPRKDVETVLKRALEKKSGRVGRTGKLETEEKARLAVAAHIRHRHTDYDRIMRSNPNRDKAREQVFDEMQRVIKEWGGEGMVKSKARQRGKRKRRRRAERTDSQDVAPNEKTARRNPKAKRRRVETQPSRNDVISRRTASRSGGTADCPIVLDLSDDEGEADDITEESDGLLSDDSWEFSSSVDGEDGDEDEDEFSDVVPLDSEDDLD